MEMNRIRIALLNESISTGDSHVEDGATTAFFIWYFSQKKNQTIRKIAAWHNGYFGRSVDREFGKYLLNRIFAS